MNGAENGLTNIASLSWDECTKYIIETKHVYNTDSFIMDKTYFEALPEEYQTIIRDAAVELHRFGAGGQRIHSSRS